MAFFGLTALGPQNSFAAAATTSRNLQIFEDIDFQRAWEKVNKEAKHCRLSKIPEIMEVLFRGPVPPNDKIHIDKAFEDQSIYFETRETVSFAAFMRIMTALRDQSQVAETQYDGKLKPTCEFNSSRDFQTDLIRHHRMERNLQQKQISPLTSTQEYGWEQPSKLAPPVAGKPGSDITKFAAELVKNGIYY